MMTSLIERYLEENSYKYGSKTREEKRRNLENLRKYSDKASLKEIDKKDVSQWIKHKREDKGDRDSSINQYLGNIRNFYEWLIKRIDKENENVRDRYKNIIEMENQQSETRRTKYHKIEHIRKIMKNLEKDYRIRWFAICYYFGLSRGEAISLKSDDDVNFDRQVIEIRRENAQYDWGERVLPFHSVMEKYLRSDGEYVISCRNPSTFYWKDIDILDFQVTNRQLEKTFERQMIDELARNDDTELSFREAQHLTKKLKGRKVEEIEYRDDLNEAQRKKKAMREWHYLLGKGIL